MKFLALLPFGYMAVTRLRTLRDFLYLALTQWGAGILLTYRLSERSPLEAVFGYAVGYLAFVSVYEIGYFVNDTWDASKQPNARARFPIKIGAVYCIAFVVVRVAVWITVSNATGHLLSADWLMMYAALVIVFALHNLFPQNHIRLATFVQLTLLRYILPILATVGMEHLLMLLVVASVFYLHFRSLAFLDSKDLLAMQGRKDRAFGLVQILIFLPLAIIISHAMQISVFLELWLYYALLYGVWYTAGEVGAR